MEQHLKQGQTPTGPKITIVNIYTLIALSYSVFFTIFFYFVAQNHILFVIHLFAIIGVIVNYILVKKTENFQRGAYILLSMGTTIMLFLFATGGWENSGILWPFAYLPAAFFMIDGKGGRIFPYTLFTGCLIIAALHFLNIITVPWSPVVLFNFFAALLVFIILMILYQDAMIKYETERNEAEKRKTELLNELEIANKELESFTYSVSHDLRAPLRTINGFTKILEKDYKDKIGEEGKRLMDTVIAEALRMGNLIDDLLAFSRLGKKELQKATIDTNALVQSIMKEVPETDLKNKKIILNNLLPCNGDSALLYQVFFNLISNALKYSRTKPNPVIEIGSYEKGNENIYFIKDNGVGFEMKYYAKLFNVFQRLHSLAEFEGTGIGLAIVSRIVSRHGGRVWAEGKVDEGATFYFSLPKF